MATKLFLRDTVATAVSTDSYYMSTSAGTSTAQMVVVSTTSTAGQQWTTSTGTGVIRFVTGPANTAFTLTLTDISIWAGESNMSANNGGGYQVFKISTSGVETAVGGGRFDDGVEFSQPGPAEMTWAGNVTDTAFSTGQRVAVKIYTVPVGTGAAGFTCTLTYNGADAATGDSFLNLNETVTFGQDAQNFTSGPHTATATGTGSRVLAVSETRSATAVGAGSRVIQTQLGAQTATATGAVTHSESFVFTTVATATAIGVATGSTLLAFGVVGTAVAVGVATGTAVVSYLVSALATAIGVTSHSENYIPAAGDPGGGNDIGSALRRAGAWVAAIFRPGGLFE